MSAAGSSGSDLVRQAFQDATDFFLTTLAAVQPEQWDAVGLGGWSVRELVGHTSRALLTVETYLDRPASAAEDAATPADYICRVQADRHGTAEAVLQRGREASCALGLDPLGAVREIAARVLARVEAANLDQLLSTPAGGMRLRAYLPTRTFELTVHTLDLAAAIGRPRPPPASAAAASLALVAELSLRAGQAAEVLLALTGRRPLPEGFSLI